MKKYIFILLSFLLITPAYAQQNLTKIRIDRFEKGMASNILGDLLEPNQGASMVNVVLDRPGRLSKRKGQALFVEDVGSTAFTGIGRFDPDRTTSYLVAASGTDVINALSSSSEWGRPNAGLTSGQDTEFIQANNQLFVLNGFDNTGWWNGSAFTPSGTYPSSPPSATTGAWLRNYLFLGGATTETDWVYFSNNLDPTTFDASDIIKINTGDGQAIQHLEPYRLNELIIYKEKSIFVLDITGSTPLTDWTVQPISKVVGTIAPRSVVSLGNDQWFLSSEPIAIRSLARSSFDKILTNLVSRPIQDIFDGTGELVINTAQIQKAAAILFDDKYILAIPTGTSLVNNTVVVHDFNVGAWYLITGWFPADWVLFDKRLFYIDANDGRVIECFSGTTGDFAEGPSTILPGQDPQQGINFRYVTRNLNFDNPENFKLPDAIETEFEATGNFTATVYLSLDESQWANIGTVNLAGDSRTLPADLPVALSQSGEARKTFQINRYGEFKKMKIMVENTASQETVTLQRVSVFGAERKWRRE